ncbi:MAG TPA: SIR2 family protein [Hyphomonas sp.]|nr:SIR2 family protein [Hyphomonas sp.]
MQLLLLLGAGFSRNWGGWLATEAFEYLLGADPIASNPRHRQLLWKHYDSGGFEGALSEIQTEYRRDPAGSKQRLEDFQFAIRQMFDGMNRRFRHMNGGPAWDPLTLFLDRFDAIFTLNQDVLLELWYLHTVGHRPRHRGWKGAAMPGIDQREFNPEIGGDDWSRVYELDDSANGDVAVGYQPYFKLHGSSNWLRNGKSLLVMGTGKSGEINENPLLRMYFEVFQNKLSAPDTRLMVIGYGFKDEHINSALLNAASRGMQMFVIDPAGSNLLHSANPTRSRGSVSAKNSVEELFESALIGASRRSLLDIFSKRDMIEYDKLERFLNE